MKHPQSNIRKAVNRTVSVLFSVLVLLMVVAACYFVYCNISGKVAFIGNHAYVKIITPSMEPTIPTGTYIVAERIEADSVNEGDIIMFYSSDPAIYGKVNTHRVVKIVTENGERTFITRGDNNHTNDPYPVSQSAVIGRYVKNADRMTAFVGFFSKPLVFFAVIFIPAAMLVAFSARDVIKKAKEARMNRLVEDEVKRLREEGMQAAGQSKDDTAPQNCDSSNEKEPTDDV